MGSFLNPGMFNGVFEPVCVPEGEYQLRIINAEDKVGKTSGNPYMNVALEIISEPKAKNIYHMLFYPAAGDDEKKRNGKLSSIQNFFKAFSVEITDNFDVKSMIGNTGWAILKETKDEFGEKNEIKKVVVPK